jgi:phytoene desaturase
MIAIDGECISIVVRVPNLFFGNITWTEDTVEFMRNKTISALKKIPGLGDIEENIIYENYLTPQNLKDSFNSYGAYK